MCKTILPADTKTIARSDTANTTVYMDYSDSCGMYYISIGNTVKYSSTDLPSIFDCYYTSMQHN